MSEFSFEPSDGSFAQVDESVAKEALNASFAHWKHSGGCLAVNPPRPVMAIECRPTERHPRHRR